MLRTKTKAIGLNRKELEGLAQKIDKNLQLEEDASDEEVDAAAEEAIEAALPFLEPICGSTLNSNHIATYSQPA